MSMSCAGSPHTRLRVRSCTLLKVLHWGHEFKCIVRPLAVAAMPAAGERVPGLADTSSPAYRLRNSTLRRHWPTRRPRSARGFRAAARTEGLSSPLRPSLMHHHSSRRLHFLVEFAILEFQRVAASTSRKGLLDTMGKM